MISAAIPSFFSLDSSRQSYLHSAVLLMVLGVVTFIARLVKETHRGRVVSRQNEKKSDHRIEQSPRRPDTKLDTSNPKAKSNRIPSPDKPYLDAFPDLSRSADLASEKDRGRMKKDKELYWKLQNLENHRDVVPEACTRLVELFDQTLSESLRNPSDTILSIPSYDPSDLRNFLHGSHRSAAKRYEAYLGRRKAGGPREMFPTKEYALEWLRLAGVVKYVDGGWLGGILGVGNGRASCLPDTDMDGQGQGGSLERIVAKMAWQVISEEFGDGDLQKNHIYLYEKLLNDIKAGALQYNGSTSPGYMKGFDGLNDDQGVPRCWEAAVAQQCIGLLASTKEFFPEALGFNMAYESLPYHLLVTARELQELKIDNYYFAIHVTIDNADSGHSAMARMAVERYLEGVRARNGEEAMKNVWKRVQTGYILAEGLPTTPSGPVEFEPVKSPEGKMYRQPRKPPGGDVPTPAESRLVEVIMRKANAAEKMHCTSRMKIGLYTVEKWLDPSALTEEKTLSFIRALAAKRPFVIPGEPEKSRFVRDLEWGGKMFGAFTGSESDVVKAWIISLQPKIKSEGTYEKFVGPVKSRSDKINTSNTAFAQRAEDLWAVHNSSPIPPLTLNSKRSALDLPSGPSFTQATSVDYRTIRPIWYISTSLFECFPLQPSRFATPLGMASLRLIRSLLGFGALHLPEDICAGTDDLGLERQNDMSGLWELGENLDLSCQIKSSNDIKLLAQNTPKGRVNDFCAKLLDLRARPYVNAASIFGVCLALCKGLQSNEGIVGMLEEEKDRTTLRRIVDEQIATILEFTAYQVERKEVEWEEGFVQGFMWAKQELLAVL
ncbi:hypothetical protein I302_106344 [Kwoniella bestiolae CBS 10118]|uniref:Uncharacterized protein n=1 Tax=Kwoniella bestiolae CBS 10118 TaxID=1296100 RepID=A0AAJ8KBH8_9TREE